MSLYRRINKTEIETWKTKLSEDLLKFYSNAEILSITSTELICKIPDFTDKVFIFYVETGSYISNSIKAYLSDSFDKSKTGDARFTNKNNILTYSNGYGCPSNVVINYLLTNHGFIISASHVDNELGDVILVTKASDENYYASGITTNDNGKSLTVSRTVNLVDGSVNYINPLGTPSYMGINNEKFNLELHKVTLVDSNLRPVTDIDGVSIVLKNFFASINNDFERVQVYFYKRGLMTSNLCYQGVNQWSKRSFFFIDDVDGAMIEEDTEEEPTIE